MGPSLESFIHRKITVLHETETAFQAARAMCENQIGCVIVTRNGRIDGILTDRDLVCEMLAMDLNPDTELGELVSSPLIFADEDSGLHDVIALMEKFGVRRIPILSAARHGQQRCVGLVTLDDLIAGRAVDYDQASRIVRSQIRARFALYPFRAKANGHCRFLAKFAVRAGLREDQARIVIKFVLAALVRRLHYTAAMQLISLVPMEFRQELLDLPAGPDRSIDAAYILAGIASHIRSSVQEAQETVSEFWSAIHEGEDKHRFNQVLVQLPRDLRRLFLVSELPGGADPHWPHPPQ